MLGDPPLPPGKALGVGVPSGSDSEQPAGPRVHIFSLSVRTLRCKKTDLSQAEASGQLLTPSQVCPRNDDGQLPATKLPTFGGPPAMSAQSPRLAALQSQLPRVTHFYPHLSHIHGPSTFSLLRQPATWERNMCSSLQSGSSRASYHHTQDDPGTGLSIY